MKNLEHDHNMLKDTDSTTGNHSKHEMESGKESVQHAQESHASAYKKLFWMLLISFLSMFLLMYAMVDKLANVIPNINQLYMAGLMASPMLIIELLLMGKMYPNKKLNKILMGLGVLMMVLFWSGIRQQTAVGDVQFLKSMIPHHAGAILMVEESNLVDPEVRKLGEEIIKAQEEEIAVMRAKIKELQTRK